jgi:hypothetical protein
MKSNIIQGVLFNRFGKGIPITPTDKEGWSETHVEVALSDVADVQMMIDNGVYQ